MLRSCAWSMFSTSCLIAVVVVGLTACGLTHAKGTHKVHCTEDQMRVEIGLPDASPSSTASGADHDKEKPQIYLEGLKGYPDERCQPALSGSLAVFQLSLSDFYECGVTRMVNQLTGKKVYYHKIVIETGSGKELVGVKCVITNGPVYNVLMNATDRTDQPSVVVMPQQQQQHQHQQSALMGTQYHHGVVRRDVLPAGFQEPEDLEITTSLTERAPEPRLGISVSQNGKSVSGDLTVRPGTPLTMEINLDQGSAPIYGLGVNYLEVTDTRQLSETIIFKGCTVDPYLFENFNTIDGDTVNAKFKAFKFPDSSYVQFRATVNVCLDKCLGTQCSNGQVGYGRRRRDISGTMKPALIDTNKVYEISLAMFIKVEDIEGVNRNEVLQLEEKLRELKLANQRLARNSRDSFGESVKELSQSSSPMSVPAFVVDERELSQAQSSVDMKSSLCLSFLLTIAYAIYSL